MNTILIAESDACVRTVLRDQLHARFKNARILEVDNSWDVVTFAIAAKPDMILLNEAMSRQNAYVTAARLRTMPLMSETKLVGYSLDDGKNAPTGLRHYCDQYLNYEANDNLNMDQMLKAVAKQCLGTPMAMALAG